ncbi:MAG TPA: FAD-dependent oxidoreductase [Spirochaetia bacterium]|nr:FAD-dependent oxidoreductase [Spirochaetia bacterium]
MSGLRSARVSLLLPRSHSLTDANKTGSWSFIQPRYGDKTAPCGEACPCAEDIPRLESLAARGLYAEALRAVLEENPFPATCGRVCFHPCEARCNRAELDGAVAINALERFLSDAARDAEAPSLAGSGASGSGAGKRVAVLGGGPAGLSAAYFLARLGFSCELLEAAPELGGLLRYGIPAYRLPPEALDRDIERITRLGIAARTGARVDASFLAREAAGYDAVVVACGKSRPERLALPGAELAGDALAFLAAARADSAPSLAGKRVAVIGGGNGAVDAARTALRLGASATILYRRRREDMPAFADELRGALDEGVSLRELRAPASLARRGDGSILLAAEPMRLAGIGPDGRGRVERTGSPAEELAFDAVYAAIGAAPDEAWAIPASSLKLGRCAIDLAGSPPRAYLGDLASASLPALAESVADAIGSGKEAAIALDALFSKGPGRVEAEVERSRVGGGPSVSLGAYLGGERGRRSRRVVAYADLNPDYLERRERELGPELSPAEAARGFAELRAPLSPSSAIAQAERCFSCGLCNDCDNCRTFCPEVAVRLSGGRRAVDTDYCKGCGICVTECPRSAMSMEEPVS